MDKLIDIVNRHLEKKNLKSSVGSAEVLYKANQILSGLFNGIKGVKAYRFENGTIFIASENSALSQELWGMQERILDELKTRLGGRGILKIRIKSLTIE